MTQPIKPTGPTPLGSSGGLDALDALENSRPSAEAEAGAAVRASQGGAAAQGVQSSSARVIAELQAGRISHEQAVDALVAEALTKYGAAKLSPARQAELSAVLRSTLLEDPAIAGLLTGR